MKSNTYITVLDEAEQILEGANYHSLSAQSLYNEIESALDQYNDTPYISPALKFSIAKGIKEWCDTI